MLEHTELNSTLVTEEKSSYFSLCLQALLNHLQSSPSIDFRKTKTEKQKKKKILPRG